MSFLDAITAGFGCVVLLFMLVSANAVLDQRTVVENREAEARRWELRVLTGQRNSCSSARRSRPRFASGPTCSPASGAHHADPRYRDAARDADRGLRSAARGDRAPAQRARRAQQAVAGARDDQRDESEDATRLRSFQGEGNRQYLTGLRMGGRHVVILVDTSTSMLDRTIVNICGAAHDARAAAPLAEVAAGRQHRRLAVDADRARHRRASHRLQRQGDVVDPGQRRQMGHRHDGSELDAPVEALRKSYPQGPTSLHVAFNAIKTLEPKPDNIYLLTDGLPTMGEVIPTRAGQGQ